MKRETVKFGVDCVTEYGGCMIAGTLYGVILAVQPKTKLVGKASLFTTCCGLGMTIGAMAAKPLNEVVDAVYDLTDMYKGLIKEVTGNGESGDEYVYDSEAREVE